MAQEHLFLTVRQATRRLNEAGMTVTQDTVQRWCRDRKIAATRLPGGQYRINVTDVDAILRPAEVGAA